MIETFDIAGYARISVDDEQEQKNISIENQKAIIEDFVKTRFPGSTLTFFEDRDRSGYTFEQREGYQEMRRGLMRHKYDILIIKDFSRFSRRNSRGLVELEDLRDAGVRIVTLGQYLRPTLEHYPVAAYITPEKFEWYRLRALEMGFSYCASAPLVRSSYMAEEALCSVKSPAPEKAARQ